MRDNSILLNTSKTYLLNDKQRPALPHVFGYVSTVFKCLTYLLTYLLTN